MKEYYFGNCCTHDRHAELVSASDNSLQGIITRLKKAFNNAAQHIHNAGRFNAEMMNDAPVKSLITETNNAFTKAVNTGISQDMPEAIRQSFQKDVYIFSGMKTYTQLKEASQLLLDDKGNIKPFQQFAQDILSINDKYNQQYLEAEYNYAVASAQMADKWQELAQDADRYYLQYRTAGDNRVRPEHAVLNKITLPATDDFWNKYYPPNGWNCRCTVVKVLRTRYTASDNAEAQKLGEAATTKLDKNGNNAAAIFRMNAGKQQIIFPPQHPYYPQYCNGAKLNVSKIIGKSQILLASESDRCKAKSIVEKMADKEHPLSRYAGVEFKKEDGIQNGGVLEVPTNAAQHDAEFLPNKQVLTTVAGAGKKYRMLPVINDGKPNPDALNLDTNLLADVKVSTGSNVKNIITNGVKNANKQGSAEVIIKLNNKYSSRDIYAGLRASMQPGFNKNMQKIILVTHDNKVVEYNTDDLRKRFNKKQVKN